MIEYVRGTLAELTPTYAVVEVGGIGYLLHISLQCYDRLHEQGLGSPVKLLAHEVIREDAHALFGFLTERERELFRLLLAVSGVGAQSARMILSAMDADELSQVISAGDDKRLKSVKGIGAKTAQRIIVDLADKIKPGAATQSAAGTSAANEAFDEALAALVMLGYPRAAAHKALTSLFRAEPALTPEAAIKRAFSLL